MKKAGTPTHPVLQVLRNLVEKLRQHPEVYPIRYYKKGKRFRRHWQGPLVK
ncbi:MAG: hypothetical protein U0X40_11585 [Ferruginibacter sp.]